ncbi:transcriptional regulator [Pseudomonas argentinensis]|uniref:Pyocin activator protein PrtN n=1 Tax=Phytopseudomonas argentinensis TaxID=289370 RepID=A0A1I3PD18_9GAMM|nr:pyocin activator PrtN family protein [Pseudomonas argentinensis]KAB0546152.1 transcriptional regulator [Pseudomonas argentinensis]SFJ19362.1 Pyocin activator protein PrtN [Pseudomonas argentinensis]
MNTQPEPHLPLQTLELLFRTHGDVLVPIDRVRTVYFRHLSPDNFIRAIACGRLNLPITTLDSSAKAPKFIELHHLAAYIDSCASAANGEASLCAEAQGGYHLEQAQEPRRA